MKTLFLLGVMAVGAAATLRCEAAAGQWVIHNVAPYDVSASLHEFVTGPPEDCGMIPVCCPYIPSQDYLHIDLHRGGTCPDITRIDFSILDGNCVGGNGGFTSATINQYGDDATFIYYGCGNIAPPMPGVQDANNLKNLPGAGHRKDCPPPPPGMPVWRVSEPWISLAVEDTPLAYQPAVGPMISFSLDFGQQETAAGYDTNLFSLGKKWNFSWSSYVTADGWGNGVVHFPEGGSRAYTNGVIDYLTNTKLTGATNTGYTLTYPDGSGLLFGFLVTNASGSFIEAMMTEQVNPAGQATYFNYSASSDVPPVVRLETVVDGDGQVTSITYVTGNPYSTNLISDVTDPFGRTASFAYDYGGHLTNITDVASMSSSLLYDTNEWVTNLTTPYGTTSFLLADAGGTNVIPNARWIEISEPEGAKQLYLFTNSAPSVPSSYGDIPDLSPYTNALDNSSMDVNNSFHWDRLQYSRLSSGFRGSGNVTQLTANDFLLGRMKHWLRAGPISVSETLSMEREASPDGTATGERIYYAYDGTTNTEYIGTQVMPLFEAMELPGGTTHFTRTDRNSLGAVTRSIETWSATAGSSVALRTNTLAYAANGIDLVAATNSLGVGVLSNIFNAYHQVATNYDALGEKTVFTYNGNQQLSSATGPSGLVVTNIYFGSGSSVNHLASTIDYAIVGGSPVYYRTNSFTWSNGLVHTHTNPRGLTVTDTWDALQRLLEVDFPDSTSILNTYDKLNLVRVIDRLGFTNSFGYNPLGQMVVHTNANGVRTLYEYCTCGAPTAITNAFGTPVQAVTTFTYDNQGNRLTSTGPDGYLANYNYNALGQLTNFADAVSSVTNSFNNQGMQCIVSNAFGLVSGMGVDILDRPVQTTNANHVVIGRVYDNLNRVATNSYPDGGIEQFGYTLNVAGVTSYINQIGSNVANYVYDPLGRKTLEMHPDVATNQFSYGAADDLLALTNGMLKVTTWTYDIYGLVSNKFDADNNLIFAYKYDADERLTNRWTPAKGNTGYAYDRMGNLLSIAYPVSPSISFGYDALNRRTNMVDAVGTTTWSHNAIGQVLSEDGPWTDDTIAYTYANRLRSGLSLQAPNASPWTQSYVYDGAKRLTGLTSPAGAFNYSYDATRQMQVAQLTLPNGAYIANTFDAEARLLSTALKNSANSVLNSHSYSYDLAGQRTEQVFTAGNYTDYTYDNIGQLLTARGNESGGVTNRMNEQYGYGYDHAGNLNSRTNNDLIETFAVNDVDELTTGSRTANMTVAGTTTSHATGVTVNGGNAVLYSDYTFARTNVALTDGNNTFTAIAQDSYSRKSTNVATCYLPASTAFVYDANGNLKTNGQELLVYDDENELVTNWVAGSWKSEFVYDGLHRRRIERDYAWSGSSWSQTNEIRFIYDGRTPIQHRDANNLPTLTLTRGPDLSGSLQGAGGIGGLLAMTESLALNPVHSYYHCDAGGNITCLLSTNQIVSAKAQYDPYGNFISISGAKAAVNPYWFSSKPLHSPSGKYDFLYRWYAPNIQRWVNRDPVQELAGVNLYAYIHNRPVNTIDPLGLLTPLETSLLQAEASGTSQLIAQQQAKIQSLAGEVDFWKDAANAAAKGGWDVRGVCTTIYNGLKADLANANAELAQLQALQQRIKDLLAGGGAAGAAALGGLYSTTVGVFTAPTVGASFTGFGITGGVIAGTAVVGAAAAGGAIGYGASQLPVVGGGTVADFWGDVLYDAFYKTCPTCTH